LESERSRLTVLPFFLGTGNTFGVRDADGRLIATAVLLPPCGDRCLDQHGARHEQMGVPGLATRLVHRCLAAANALKLTTWLDATPASAAVYGRLGFTPTLELRRLRLRGRVCVGSGGVPLPLRRANALRAAGTRHQITRKSRWKPGGERLRKGDLRDDRDDSRP
jgi:hypothetical protein